MKRNILLKIATVFSILFINFNAHALPDESQIITKESQDSIIVAMLDTFNKNEILLANLALKQGHSQQVKDYAKMMRHDHSKNYIDTRQIAKDEKISPVSNETITSMQKEAQDKLSELKKLKGLDFDKSYMQLMQKEHVKVIEELEDMIKNAQNEELKQHLKTTKEHVSHHLEQAQIILNNLS